MLAHEMSETSTHTHTHRHASLPFRGLTFA